MFKIQAAEGRWLDKAYFDIVYPKLTEHDIPIVRQESLRLTELNNQSYWDVLRLSKRIQLGYLDANHWYFNDATFREYVQKIASAHLDAVCLSEMPCQVPVGIEPDIFEAKLYQRTKEAYEILDKKSPDTIVVSPPIGITDPNFRERYLDYFIQNRSYFDVWGMVVVYDMKEQISGLLTALLTQIIQVLRKQVWIIKWAVPACDHGIESRFTLDASTWTQTNTRDAALKMETTFRAVEEITRSNTVWFFTGLGRDDYRPDEPPPDLWNPDRLYALSESSWGFQHFLGLLDHQKNLKQPIFDAFIKLCKKYNE